MGVKSGISPPPSVLQYDESDVYEDFRNFFSDALPEFSKAGKIVQFKVSTQ